MKKLRISVADLTDEIREKKPFSIGTYMVLGIVAVVMTVLNIITDKGILTWCTGVFALLCAVNILLTFINRKAAEVAKVFFAAEVVLMFTFFLVTGNPEGFSAIWICMLPSLGMFFFDRYRGSAICAAMFLILIFFLWTPYGNGLLIRFGNENYTETFRMRFPILFIAFHVLAFFLETLRANAYKEMRRLQDYYQDLSVRDQLTGMFNRQGMYSALENEEKFKAPKVVGITIFDIDHFKEVNDTYGHNVGDSVLRDFAEIIKSETNALVCRWGGEEFVSIAVDGEVQYGIIDKVKEKVEAHEFSAGDKKFRLTVSAGVMVTEDFDIKAIDAFIDKADKALYVAKNTGRNRIVNFGDIC